MDGFNTLIKNLGPGRIILLAAVTLLTVGLLALMVSRVSQPSMALLYGNLDSTAALSITNQLETQNIPYELRGDSAVYVPSDQVSKLRLELAGQGLVGGNQGGYEILDNASALGTSALVQDINARRALEGELARTIMSLPAVTSARVHLVMPKKRVFLQDDVQPTASVTLDLGSRVLEAGQVKAIAHLVAAAVPNLKVKDVTVVDNRGNLLTHNTDLSETALAMTATSQFKQQIEADYANALTKMLEKVTGAGKVNVKVNAEVDFDRIEENAELFDPAQQVIRSEQQVEETSSDGAGGDGGFVGASSNLPAGGAEASAGAGAAASTSSRTEATTNYEISKTVRRSLKEGGRIKRLSVAVLVEGKYQDVDGQSTYTPWTSDDLGKFRNLVESAIGFDATRGDKVEIIDLPFTVIPVEEAPPAPFLSKGEMMKLAEYAMLLLGAILIVLFVLRPIVRTILSAVPAAAGPGTLAMSIPRPGAPGVGTAPGAPLETYVNPIDAAPESMINLDKVSGKVRESSVRKVGEIMNEHRDESLGVIRQWLSQTNQNDDR